MSDTIDVPVEVQPQQALTVRDAVGTVMSAPQQPEAKPQVTAAQAKVEAIANLTFKAYERAATLELSTEEVQALQAEFPDEAFKPGAAGKENLIYIEHAFLRDRLNQVFGPGRWAVIPRSRWAEDFRTNAGKPGSRVYVEAMLLVRGAFVAEAIGEMEYFPHNASQNYGDAVEGAKTAALRRCCKELGIGLQAWKKDWCDGWWQRRRAAQAGQRGAQQPPPPPQVKPAPKSAAAPQQVPEGEQTFPRVDVQIVAEKSGTSNGKPWRVWFCKFDDGFGQFEAGTFDTKIADLALELSNTGEAGTLVVRPGRKPGTREIVSLERISEQCGERDPHWSPGDMGSPIPPQQDPQDLIP